MSGVRRLLLTVSAFTLSHTVTLTLATLGFVHVPPAPVEAVIALSILFVAWEVLRKKTQSNWTGAAQAMARSVLVRSAARPGICRWTQRRRSARCSYPARSRLLQRGSRGWSLFICRVGTINHSGASNAGCPDCPPGPGESRPMPSAAVRPFGLSHVSQRSRRATTPDIRRLEMILKLLPLESRQVFPSNSDSCSTTYVHANRDSFLRLCNRHTSVCPRED